ncbi:MAG: hypothetical protein WEB57_08415 [Pseudohongiellaceae bacterium]
MTWFIFAGDMLVTLFMVVLVVWLTAFASKDKSSDIARIPLEDERYDG